MGWISRQFTTRTIVLMPIAIAINIVLGLTVQTVLKLPIYLDSIGTILVGVLAGPIAGALTGVLSNLIWQYAPGGGNIGPFAITAGVIGLLAGLWGYLGVYRSRPASRNLLIIAAVIAAVIIGVVVYPILNNPAYTDPKIGGYPSWVFGAIVLIGILAAVMVAGFILLSARPGRVLGGPGRGDHRDRGGIRLGADLGVRLRRRDRLRRGRHRGGPAPGRFGRHSCLARPGPVQ